MTSENFLAMLKVEGPLQSSNTIHEAFRILKQASSIAAQRDTMQFSPGDRVTWNGRAGEDVTGTVLRTNSTTVAVRTDEGKEWRVSTGLLKKLPETLQVVALDNGKPVTV